MHHLRPHQQSSAKEKRWAHFSPLYVFAVDAVGGTLSADFGAARRYFKRYFTRMFQVKKKRKLISLSQSVTCFR